MAKAQFFDAGYGDADQEALTLTDVKRRNPFARGSFSHVLQVAVRIIFGQQAFQELKDLADPSKTVIVPIGGRSKNIGGSRILIQKRKTPI